jgi:predicted site-specific integrase-resolvase
VRCGLITATQAAQVLQISRKTYYKWEQRGLAALLEGVEDQHSGRPETPPEQTQKAAFDKELKELQQKNELLGKQLKLKDLVHQMHLKENQEGVKKK